MIDKTLANPASSLEQIMDDVTPTVYETLKTAVELGKWDDGTRLTAEQLEYCMQAIILYERENLPEHERTGADLTSGCKSKTTH